MTTSDDLSKLTSRAKQAEQRATDAARQAVDDLQKSVDSARASAEAEAAKLRDRAGESGQKVSSWWDDQQRSWNEHLAKVRKHVDEKKSEHDFIHLENMAELAEADAGIAIDYAYSAIEEAEYSVLNAILARAEVQKAEPHTTT